MKNYFGGYFMDNFRRYIVCLLCLLCAASCVCIQARAIEPEPTAKAAILIEADTGRILYEKNADTPLQMASTTKIMTTLLTLESGGLDDYFEVDPQAIKVEGSSMGLKEGAVVTKRILAYGMMLPSGNDAANAAAVKVGGSIEAFVEMMNKRAAEIGLESTHFVTPSGLDDDTFDHYSTAKDMANLTREALKNEDFREICSTRSIQLTFGDGTDFWLSNSNRLLSSCEGVIGVKTGFTDKAGRCLVSACERDGVTLICITLNDPNDWYDHNRLYDYGFERVTTKKLEGVTLKLPVVGGEDGTVTVRSEDVTISLLPGESGEVERKITVMRFGYLPLEVGDVVGRVTYYLDGSLIAAKDIVVTEKENNY